MSVDSALRVEVELIHSTCHTEVSQALRCSVDSSLALPILTASPSPYAKQIPSSTYSAYKNATSFDNLTSRQELYTMISHVSTVLYPKDAVRCHKIEKELLQAYEKSLQMDTRLSTAIWSECLLALFTVRREATVISSRDADLTTIEQELGALLSDYINNKTPKQPQDIVDSVGKLSQQFRILIKKLQGEQIVSVSELLWKTTVLLFDELLAICKREVAGNYAEVEKQAKREEARIGTQLRVLTEQWQARLNECTQENLRLHQHERRLKEEVSHCMELISERDEELKQLRDSGAFVELEKMLADFVANAGDDPGTPELPKSLYGSAPVQGVKMNPTRFGAGKPAPVAGNIEPLIVVPATQPTPQPVHVPVEIETESSEESVEIPPLPTWRPLSYTEIDGIFPLPQPQNVIREQLQRYPQPTHIFRSKDVFKLFEAVMDAKFEFDVSEEAATFRTRSLSEFTLDYLYQKHGKRSETLKHAASLVKTLEKMRADGDKYADLFYCLLGLSDYGEFDLDLSLFLVKARTAFQDQLLKSKGKSLKADKEVGGKLPFAEVSDLIYSLFKEQREVGEEVLARVVLPDVDEVEKAKLGFCGRLGKIGRDLKYFFVHADSAKAGSISFQVFIKTCRTTLEMNLSMDSLKLLWGALTSGETLNYPQLTAIDFKAASTKAYSKPLAISKLILMNCVTAQYFAMRQRDEDRLKRVFHEFDANSDGVLTLGEFSELVTSLDPDCLNSKIVQLFREAVESRSAANPDSISPDSFCRMALQNRLGGFGKSVFQSRLTHLVSKSSEESPRSSKKKSRKKQ